MKRINKWVRESAHHLYERLRRPRAQRYTTQIVQNYLPKKLQDQTLYVVRDDRLFEQVAMLCPCGCKHILHMNLLPDDYPCWRLTRHKNGTITLSPSIRRLAGCRSHFWFRRGCIRWFESLNSARS